MTERISLAYSFSSDEMDVINDNFTSHLDWGKGAFDLLKLNMISHLREQQNNKCCYCKKHLGFDIKDVDIEHIIPKSMYGNFTFTSQNLALSCPACNTKKSTSCVLQRQEIVRYPRSSANFKIIHPHFDNYSEHITIQNSCIYIASSKKGSETITICELFRLRKVHEQSKKYNTGKSIASRLIESLRTSNPDEVDGLMAKIKDLIQ